MRIEAVHFNGGFGRADPLTPPTSSRPTGDAAALIAAEDRLLEEVNASGGSTAARLAARERSGTARLARGRPRRRGPRSRRRRRGGAGRFQRARVRSAGVAPAARRGPGEGRGLSAAGAALTRPTSGGSPPRRATRRDPTASPGRPGRRARAADARSSSPTRRVFSASSCARGAARSTRQVLEIAEKANAVGCGRRRGQEDRRRQAPEIVIPAMIDQCANRPTR